MRKGNTTGGDSATSCMYTQTDSRNQNPPPPPAPAARSLALRFAASSRFLNKLCRFDLASFESCLLADFCRSLYAILWPLQSRTRSGTYSRGQRHRCCRWEVSNATQRTRTRPANFRRSSSPAVHPDRERDCCTDSCRRPCPCPRRRGRRRSRSRAGQTAGARSAPPGSGRPGCRAARGLRGR